MSTTVVIPTFNRPSKLRTTISALEKQDDQDFHVIIVNDGSTEENTRSYEELTSTCKLNIRLITIRNQGIASATNTGINASADGLIILTDDDTIPAPDFVSRHRTFHLEHPGCILTGRAYFSPSLAKNDVQRYKSFMDDEWCRILFPGTARVIRISAENFTLTAANMSFERSIHHKLGGFSTRFCDCQDFEFGIRAHLAGVAIYYDLDNVVLHNDPITLRYYAERQRSYTQHKDLVLASYPQFNTGNFSMVHPSYGPAKTIAYAILASSFGNFMVERSGLITLLPRRLRYRIYGASIAAMSREQQ
jgi:GT2 family glycosyltransferase